MGEEFWPNPIVKEDIKRFLMECHKLIEGTRAHEERIVSLIDNQPWTYDLAHSVLKELIDDNEELYSYDAFFALCTYCRRYENFSDYRKILEEYRSRYQKHITYDYLVLLSQIDGNSHMRDEHWAIINLADELCKRDILRDNYGVEHCFAYTIAGGAESSPELAEEIFLKYRNDAFRRLEDAILKSNKQYAKFFVTRARLTYLDTVYGNQKDSTLLPGSIRRDIKRAIDLENNNEKKMDYRLILLEIETAFLSRSSLAKVEHGHKANTDVKPVKIFISHSTKDQAYVEKLVTLLEKMGLSKKDVFCSSIPGYGVSLDDDIFETLQEQFQSFKLHVILVHSSNYYQSPICLNEMGAAWVLHNKCTSFLLPGFEFEDMKGVVKNDLIAIKLDSEKSELQDKLNQFHDTVISEFELQKDSVSVWERKREIFIKEVEELSKAWKA